MENAGASRIDADIVATAPILASQWHCFAAQGNRQVQGAPLTAQRQGWCLWCTLTALCIKGPTRTLHRRGSLAFDTEPGLAEAKGLQVGRGRRQRAGCAVHRLGSAPAACGGIAGNGPRSLVPHTALPACRLPLRGCGQQEVGPLSTLLLPWCRSAGRAACGSGTSGRQPGDAGSGRARNHVLCASQRHHPAAQGSAAGG